MCQGKEERGGRKERMKKREREASCNRETRHNGKTNGKIKEYRIGGRNEEERESVNERRIKERKRER